jgi:ribosomal protein S17E
VNINEINNFDHNIVYSDDEETVVNENIKKISFGNLNITVSKKNEIISNDKEIFKELIRNSSQLINESEMESDEEKEIPIENIVKENSEKVYNQIKNYVTDFTENIKEQSVKRLRIVRCLTDIIPESNETIDQEWPVHTDIACWWCCNQFDCPPCTLPTRYDPNRKRFTFIGVFCSWSCAKSYSFSMTDHQKNERNNLLCFLVQQLYGVKESISIRNAPPRQTLKMFGGYLDISDFRSNKGLVESYHMNLIKYNYIHPEITEIKNIKVKPEKKNLRISRN